MHGNARSLGKVDGNKLLSVVLEGLKNSPQFKMPFLKRGAFLTGILENKDSISDSMDTLRRLVCLFAEEYSQLFLEFFRPSRTIDNNLIVAVDFFKRSRVTAHSFGKQQASSCSLANTRCIIIFTTTNTYLHVNLKMRFITY